MAATKEVGKTKSVVVLLFGFALAMLVTGIPARATPGQETGTARMEKAKIKQGDNITMDVAVDKASNFGGMIYARIHPDGVPTDRIDLGCRLAVSQTHCTANGTIPLGAKLGKWVISQITFTPDTGEPKVLMEHGDSSFEVVAHGDLVLPNSATVSDIK
jgi:hypothetical protein